MPNDYQEEVFKVALKTSEHLKAGKEFVVAFGLAFNQSSIGRDLYHPARIGVKILLRDWRNKARQRRQREKEGSLF